MTGVNFIRALYLLLPAFLLPYSLHSQTNTNIGGVVNVYKEVTEIISSSCQIRVADTINLKVGDKVLLIQMQGATIFNDNNSNFGDINQIGNAGKYEINYICEINTDTITLTLGLNNSYSVAGKLQLITIPQYENATITSTLTAKNWDGTTGGVLAIDVENTLTLNANIDVSGRGFRGGEKRINGSACNFFNPDWPNYFYSYNSNGGGLKGEGIALFIVNKEGGRGKQANGGGGGNEHNSGGGGGGNYGNGGIGGKRQNSSSAYCKGEYPGIGGLNYLISTSSYRLLLGGGGGAGHDNNNQSSSGGKGGGIILISSNEIIGNNYKIMINGEDALFSTSDGAGGGGAGGTIFIKCNNFGSSTLNIEALGGKGGNSSRWDTHCMGPGGGGGGGVLLLATTSMPSSISGNYSGGLNGVVDVSTTASCSLSTGGAQPGTNGGYLLSADLFQGPNTCAGCVIPLPVTWLTFTAKAISKKVQLNWSVAAEDNVDHYLVERSGDGNNFEPLISVSIKNNSEQVKDYQAIDEEPLFGYNYYRIKNVDKDGKFSYSVVRLVHFKPLIEYINLYPNPAEKNTEVTFEMEATDDGQATIFIMDLLGKIIYNKSLELQKGYNHSSISLPDLPGGIYPIRVHTQDQVYQLKLVIQ